MTVLDAEGNSAMANATINVTPAIDDEDLTATLPIITPGTSTTITTNSSLVGVNYTLRNNTGDVKVGNTIPGTGSPLSFNTDVFKFNSDI